MDNLARLEATAKDRELAGSVADAIAAWRKAVVVAPERSEPRRALAQLLRREERWADLVAALSNELERACPGADAKYAVLVEMGEIYHRHLDRTFMAINTVKRALEVNPDGLEASDLLISIYEEKQRWTDLLPLLEQRVEQTADTGTRVEILERIAEITLKRSQGNRQAVKVYERMLTEDPNHEGARDTLSDLYGQIGDWEKLIVLKKDHVLPTRDEEERLWMALELAQLAQKKVKRTDLALELWSLVRDLDPDRVEALEALDPIYRRQQAWDDLADVLARRVETSPDPDIREQLLQRLAALYEDQLCDAPEAELRAFEYWQELLLSNPSHTRARNSLREIYLRRSDLDALDELYADEDPRAYAMMLEQVLRRDQVPMHGELLRRIGQLHRDELGHARKAIGFFETLSKLDPTDRDATQALVELYDDTGDDRKLARALGRLVHLTDDGLEKAALLEHAAALNDELREPVRALACWLEVLVLNPEGTHALNEAERLAGATGEWQRLVDTYKEVAPQLDHERRVARLMTVARIEEQELHDLDAATVTYHALLELEPSHPEGGEGLARVLLAQGRYEDLFEHYARELHTGAETDVPAEVIEKRLAIYGEVGDLLEKQMDKPAEALEMLARALREVPAHPATLDHLEAIAGRHNLWQPLLELYRQVTRQPLPPGAQIELRARVGRLYEEHLADAERALSAYQRVLDLDPRHDAALSAVSRLSS